MLILAVDTTTLHGSVALLKGTRLLMEVNHDSPRTFSERLLPTIHGILKANSLRIQDVGGFAVAVGPGSFTGIRIGISTIQSFAYASGKPVAPVSTLEALAAKLCHPPHRFICPMLDAKKNEIFGALYEVAGRKLRESVPQGAYSPDAFLSQLPARRIIHFIGSGAQVYREKIIPYFKDRARFSRRSPFIAYEVGLIGYEILTGQRGKDFREIEPLYLRKSQAETDG